MNTAHAKFNPVTLVGGGVLNAETLERALARAPRLLAADGGADRALALGQRPEKVLGDFDSLSQSAREALGIDRMEHLHDQDRTDFDKALEAIDAPLVLAVGFTGDRLDHTLAAMNTLACHPGRRVIVDSGHDLCVLAPPELTLTLPPEARVSLFPLVAMRCRSTGLVWATDHLVLDPLARIGTSNAARGGVITLRPEAQGMLLMLPVTQLDALIEALLRAPLWQDAARAR
jgi:thiamine pyrophosphokinase